MTLPSRKVDYYPATGSPDELSAADWNMLIDHIDAMASTPPSGSIPGFGTVQNTAAGQDALLALTTGTYNTAVGGQALTSLRTGTYNTAVGRRALASKTGDYSTAVGERAGELTTTGTLTALGYLALSSQTDALNNTAVGIQAGRAHVTGNDNTYLGAWACHAGTTGSRNTVAGSGTYTNGNGSYNTTFGMGNLPYCSGDSNTTLGYHAGSSVTTGSGNTILGSGLTGTAGTWNNYILIGSGGVARATYTDGVGWSFANAVKAANLVGGATGASIDADGNIVRSTSDARLKDDVRDLVECLPLVLGLRPRSFRFRPEANQGPSKRVGLVAQEVLNVLPEVVGQGADGMLSINYGEVVAVLIGAIHDLATQVNELKERT